MNKILGRVNKRRLIPPEPQPPAIVGAHGGHGVGFVPDLLNATVRDPLCAKICEFTALGQRNVQHLTNKLDRDPWVPLTKAGMEILYSGRSQAERAELLECLNSGSHLLERYYRMQQTILQPILDRLQNAKNKSDQWTDNAKDRLDAVGTTVDGLHSTIRNLDGIDIVSRRLTARNQILRIVRKAHDNSKVCEATGGTIVSWGEYEIFLNSLPHSLRETIPDILMVKEEGGANYKLRSPEDVIASLIKGQGGINSELKDPMKRRVDNHPSLSSVEEAAKLTSDSVAARVDLLDELSALAGKPLGKDKGAEYQQMINEHREISQQAGKGESSASGERKKVFKEVLCMDREISDLIVDLGESALNDRLALDSKEVQEQNLGLRSTCAQQSLALLEALTQDIDGGCLVIGNEKNPRTLLEALDLGERALTDGGVKPLWSFTFDHEDSETQFSAAEQLKREASFLSGTLIVGMGNIFADVETLNKAKVAYAGTMISQLLSSSPLMREAVVEVMEEELEPNPVSHLGTLSREMPTVSHKEVAKAVHDMVGQLGHGSGDTSISGDKWTQLKKALEFILKRPTHWMIGLTLVASMAALVIGAGMLFSSTVPGLIIAGTLTLSSGFLLMILGAFGVTFQPQYFSLLFGLLFGTKRTVAKVFASDRLTQLWKVTQGDRRATLAYYKSKGLTDSSGVKLTRNRWSQDSLGGDLAFLRAQAAREYVAEMGNAGLEALIKSAEERLVKLGKLGVGYNSTGGSKENKRSSALAVAGVALQAAAPDTNSKLDKVIEKAKKGQNDYSLTGHPAILGGEVELSMEGSILAQRQHLIAFPEIASLAGCLMREEALAHGGKAGDETRRYGDLACAVERVRRAFFEAGNDSIQAAVSGLTAYKGVQEAFFGQGLISDYMNIPLPRNIYTITTTVAGMKLSDARKTRLTVGGERLSQQVLSSSNTDAKKAELNSLEEPLFPPGVGFDIPAPFRELKLDVTINGEARQGTFDELVVTCCSKKSNEAVKQFTEKASNFPDLQGIVNNKGDASAWDKAIGEFTKGVSPLFPTETANYRIIVAGLCKVLKDAKPGVAIGDSKIIKPEVGWDRASLRTVAQQEGVNLECMEAMKYAGESMYVPKSAYAYVPESARWNKFEMYVYVMDTQTKNEGQLREFMRYMRRISVEYKVPFLTERVAEVLVKSDNKLEEFHYVKHFFDKDFCVQDDLCKALNNYLNALSDYKSSDLTISSDVAAFRRLAEYRGREILAEVRPIGPILAEKQWRAEEWWGVEIYKSQYFKIPKPKSISKGTEFLSMEGVDRGVKVPQLKDMTGKLATLPLSTDDDMEDVGRGVKVQPPLKDMTGKLTELPLSTDDDMVGVDRGVKVQQLEDMTGKITELPLSTDDDM